MRLAPLLSWAATASVAEAAVRDGAVPVEAAGNPLTPWLALAFVAMAATLFGAHWLVARGRRR
jgi:hypothetical protein